MKKRQLTGIATIFIPATRVSATLARCLHSLENQSRHDFRVIIVTPKSTPKKEIQMSNFSFPISFVKEDMPGLVHAANTALHMTETPLFIRLDDDTVAKPGWFDAIAHAFKDQNVGGVTGPTIIPPELRNNRPVMKTIHKLSQSDNLFLLPFRYLYFHILYEDRIFDVGKFLRSGAFTFGSNFSESIPDHSVEVDNLEACNFAIRTAILNKLGGFDTAFSDGLGEYHEADISMRIKKNQYKLLFVPYAAVFHMVQKIHPQTRQNAYDRITNFIRFYKRYFDLLDANNAYKFGVNLFIQNCYYVITFLKDGNIKALGAIPASIRGLFKNLESL